VSTTAHRLASRISVAGNGADGHLRGDFNTSLMEALRATIDNLAVGVILVSADARILHANVAARYMLEMGSPVVSAAGWLGAPQPDLAKQLREAIGTAHAARFPGGIGIPLTDTDMCAATAHVLPLPQRDPHACRATHASCAVFIASAHTISRVDIGMVGRVFGLTAAENRLLGHLLAGAPLAEAAAALGITEATAKTHRSHIFSKTGVSRRADLVTLVGRLMPPIRSTQRY
jgi:DNA-binding CsgD family transcriptional regulator